MERSHPADDAQRAVAEQRPPASVSVAEPDGEHGEARLFRERAGEALRERRLEQGLRLVDVADRAGVSPQYLSEIERGIKDPSSEVLRAAARALGLTLDDLLATLLDRGDEADAVARSVVVHLPIRGVPTSGGEPLCLAA